MTNEEAREFVERWQKAGPALDEIRKGELRNLGQEECQKQIRALFGLGSHRSTKSETSGLIEQQRLFQKAK